MKYTLVVKQYINEQYFTLGHGESSMKHTSVVSLPSQHHGNHCKWDSTTPQRVIATVNEPNECKVPTLATVIQ